MVTADAIAGTDLELMTLPDDLRDAIDELLPPRWSRNNPVDMAGGETRDTIPAVLELIARHADVDAVIYLGLGIQSNQARMMREGPFWPDHGLERIVAYHERQDARFAEAAAEVSDATGKPILTATELAVADPANAGPAAVRATGRLCYSVGQPGRHRPRPPLASRPASCSAGPPEARPARSSHVAACRDSRRGPRRLRRRCDEPPCPSRSLVRPPSSGLLAWQAGAGGAPADRPTRCRVPHAGAVGAAGARVAGRTRCRCRGCSRRSIRIVDRSPQATCLTVSAGGRTIYEHNADSVAHAGVHREARHRSRGTRPTGPERPVHAPRSSLAAGVDGEVRGDVYLVGGGDPILSTGDYADHFTDQPQLPHPSRSSPTAGEGGIDADHRPAARRRVPLRPPARYVPTWPPRFSTQNESGPLSAFTVNDNFSDFPATQAKEHRSPERRRPTHRLRRPDARRPARSPRRPGGGRLPARAGAEGRQAVGAIDSPPIRRIIDRALDRERQPDCGAADEGARPGEGLRRDDGRRVCRSSTV